MTSTDPDRRLTRIRALLTKAELSGRELRPVDAALRIVLAVQKGGRVRANRDEAD